MGAPAPDAFPGFIDRFDQGRRVFLSGDYKEEQRSKTKTAQARSGGTGVSAMPKGKGFAVIEKGARG